jgi:hypothetical protein
MYNCIASGSFTSDGTAKDISLRKDFDLFWTENWTQAGTTQSTGRGVQFKWQRGMADNAGLMWTKQNSSNAIDLEQITSGGFLRVDTSNIAPEAEKAMVSDFVTAADPANVSVNSHGYSNGDRVRVYDTTGMLQIAGYEFTIGNVSANDFELSYLDASGFAAAATAGNVRRIPNPPHFRPERNYVTGISAASSAVITLSLTHGLVVGDFVSLSIPSGFGMVEMDGLRGKVTAVSTANNTVTVDIDSTNFTAFAFPASASAGSPALLIPYGTNVQTAAQAYQDQTEILMRLGAGADGPAGSNNDVIYWYAMKSDLVNNE